MAHRYMNYLRKNAKVVMVFMCVVCMLTFVVGPYLIDLLVGGTRPQEDENPVALTWTKGNIRQADLNNHAFQRRIAFNFLAAVIQETVNRGGTPIVNGQIIQKGQPIRDVGIPGDTSDEGIVETIVMAEEARRMGIAVDQKAVIAHLRNLSYPELNEGDWREIADRLVRETNAMMTVGQLLERVAFELKAQHVRVLANAGLLAIPPGDMWNYFNRLNRRFSIEAYPVDVAPLVAQVKSEPTAAEIQALFDEGKYREPNPMLEGPGFRKPHKVAFTYVRVDFAPFLEAAKKTITDEQIKEQYDKDISQGLHKVPELPADKPPEDKQDEDKKDADKKEEEKKDDKAADDKEKKDEPKASDEKKAEEKKDEKAAPSPEDGCQAEPEKKSDEQPKEGEKKEDEKKSDEKKDDRPADDKKEDDKKEDENKPEEKKEPKFKALEEVKEEIRTKLAQPIAQDAKNKAVKEVTDAINDYGRRYRRWLSVKEFKKSKAEEPAKLDIEAIAAKHGFKVGTTPLVDRYEIDAYDIGKEVMSFDMEALRRGDFRMQRFADIAFGDDETLFDARDANSTVPDVSYVYYRTAEEKGGDVKLDDVRKQVVEAWKKKKAFDLAMDDAKKLAEKAKGASTLNTVVTDATKVITPPPFSWMTSGAVAMGFSDPELSQVPGVELAGQEFMRAVFALQPGQAGAAPNQAHSKVYLVRIVGQDPVEDVLRTQFLDTGLNFQVIGVARRDMMQTTIEWYRELEKRYAVTWLRPPRDFSRRL